MKKNKKIPSIITRRAKESFEQNMFVHLNFITKYTINQNNFIFPAKKLAGLFL